MKLSEEQAFVIQLGCLSDRGFSRLPKALSCFPQCTASRTGHIRRCF